LGARNGVAETLRLLSLFDKDYQKLWKPLDVRVSRDADHEDVKTSMLQSVYIPRGLGIFQITTFVPGVDVMITILEELRPVLAKVLAFFLKTNVMIQLFQNSSILNKKKFTKFFGKSIFQMRTLSQMPILNFVPRCKL
jgi:hypothetical protein